MDAEQQTAFVLQYASGWHLYVAVAATALLAWWSWRRYGPAPVGWAGRIARTCRVVAFALIILALTGPAWRTVTTATVPGRLLVLVDHSASMAREDGPGGQPRILSALSLYQALESRLPSLETEVIWRAIGEVSGGVEPGAFTADQAVGRRSPLGHEIEAAARSMPADLMVVVSDFRVSDGTTLEVAAETLRRYDLSAWALGVGGEGVDPELVLEDVSGNTTVALGEEQPFSVRLSGRALDPSQPIRLRIFDNGQLIAEQTVEEATFSGEHRELFAEERVDVVLNEEGTRDLEFRVEQGDLSSSVVRQVEVSTRRLQVLMLAHRPRWEMRYLQVALQRDHTVDIHAYLADGRWRRWSPSGPAELPFRAAELSAYDVVIIGDIAPSMLTPQAMSSLVAHVREGGAGLVWIPGETGNTALFQNSELGNLLPVVLPGPAALARSYLEDSALTLKRLPEAVAAAFLDPGERDWAELPFLRRIAAIEEVRDLSRVWMVDNLDRPAVISAQFGNGQAVLIAVDDTWRWRRNVGDVFLHRFHSQILRFASRARAAGSRRWRIDASPYRAAPGQEVTISVQPTAAITDSSSLAGRVTVEWTHHDGRTTLQELSRLDAGVGYQGLITAPSVGSWRIAMVDGLIPAAVAPGALTVLRPSAEARDPRFDEEAMSRLVNATGGRAFRDADELVQALPALSEQRQNEYLQSIWDHWWWLIATTLVLAVEWSVRRLWRLP